MDEIWVALRRVRLENSVKFSAPAYRGIRDSRHCRDRCFSIPNFWFFCLFPTVALAFASVRPEIAPKKGRWKLFYTGRRARHKLSKVKGCSVWAERPLGNFSYFKTQACIKVCNVNLCYFVTLSFDSSKGEKISRILRYIANLIVYRIINLLLKRNVRLFKKKKKKKKK